MNTENSSEYTVMFGGKCVKITAETNGSDGEVSSESVETSSRKDNGIEKDQFKDKTTEEDENNLDGTNDSLVKRGKQTLIELNNVSMGEEVSVSDTETAETEGYSKTEDGNITDGQSNEKDSGVESDGALKEGNGDEKESGGAPKEGNGDEKESDGGPKEGNGDEKEGDGGPKEGNGDEKKIDGGKKEGNGDENEDVECDDSEKWDTLTSGETTEDEAKGDTA